MIDKAFFLLMCKEYAGTVGPLTTDRTRTAESAVYKGMTTVTTRASNDWRIFCSDMH